MKTQVNSLKTSLLNSLKSVGNSWGNSCVQFGDNLVFYFSTISLILFQQEAKWVNINFERRDLTSAQKSHPPSKQRDVYMFRGAACK